MACNCTHKGSEAYRAELSASLHEMVAGLQSSGGLMGLSVQETRQTRHILELPPHGPPCGLQNQAAVYDPRVTNPRTSFLPHCFGQGGH